MSLARTAGLAVLCFAPLFAAAQGTASAGSPHGASRSNYQEVMRESAALYRARRFSEAHALLSAYEKEFAGDSYFDYQLGIAALEAGQYAPAQQALERAVLVRPDFAGAWVDLAITHARLDEPETALQIIAHIEESFDVPLPLRDRLIRLRAELAAPRVQAEPANRAGAATRNGYVLLSAGHDSNANLGLAGGVFTLTPVGSPPIQIEITPAARSKPDSFIQLRGDVQQILPYSASHNGRLYASGQYKAYDTLGDYNIADGLLNYTHEYALANAPGWWLEGVAGARTLSTGDRHLARIVTAGAGLVSYSAECRYGGRYAAETRDFGLDGYVDSDLSLFTLTAHCRRGLSQFGGSASLAIDTPRAIRAGGRTERFEVGLHYGRKLAPQSELIAIGVVGHYRDAAPYSPLLENGARRSVVRTSVRLTWLWEFDPARPAWLLQSEFEHLEDRSNIDIFNLKNTRVAVGLRYQY